MTAQTWRVAELEFQRVQTLLFAVSELRSMIGANALLGETLRGRLLAGGFERLLDPERTRAEVDNLPALAINCGAKLPPDVNVATLGLPAAPDGDHLPDDNPLASWSRAVLTRDGGHLHVGFADDAAAQRFVREARALVAERLPGLLLSARCRRLKREPDGWKDDGASPLDQASGETGEDVLDVPQLQVCEVTGQGPAARSDDGTRISDAVAAKRDKAVDFDAGQSAEVLGLLRGPLLTALRLNLSDSKAAEVFPRDFTKVAPSGYLAVIAADGNGIGKRSTEWRTGANYFAREARGEQFFHTMRRIVRNALVKAVADVFGPIAEQVASDKRPRLPLRLMMLGGDDLLLVCDAAFALRFVVAYAKALESEVLPDEAKKLHVGVGVAIVKKSFPFHRAHALAEQLAGSAKRLWRERPEVGSTVDWLAISEAWHEDIADVRRRDFLRRGEAETLVLSRRPYPVLGDSGSLDSLIRAGEKVQGRLPRSQLMALADAVRHGQRQARWAVELLDAKVRDRLEPVLPVWQEPQEKFFTTALFDFLEVFELERMFDAQKKGEASDA